MFIQQRMCKQKFNLLACKSTEWNIIKVVLHLRIRSRMFFGMLDPDPDPLVRGTDPDPSIIKQKY